MCDLGAQPLRHAVPLRELSGGGCSLPQRCDLSRVLLQTGYTRTIVDQHVGVRGVLGGMSCAVGQATVALVPPQYPQESDGGRYRVHLVWNGVVWVCAQRREQRFIDVHADLKW